ncbi:NAD(P)-dependent oxidoreductase [Nocardia sp. CA-129566]|uniref:NAD(P)-dependent oxidoreductase n=1 Tax=Nocardia sp. CA-129566 TaxID=3239976 RepID=UPI003D99F862
MAGADAVITMLADDPAVRAVALGELRSSIDPRTIYIDSSTISPTLSGELAASFPDRFVAISVVGSPAAVTAGQAVFLLGGGDSVIDRLGAMVSSLSDDNRRYDTAPLAIVAKLTANLLLLSGVVALAESFAVGRSGGVSEDQLRDLLGASPAVAPALRNRFESVLTGSHDGWWATALGVKDAGLALDLAHQADMELPVAAVVQRRYAAAASSGLNADIAAVADLYRSAVRAAG